MIVFGSSEWGQEKREDKMVFLTRLLHNDYWLLSNHVRLL